MKYIMLLLLLMSFSVLFSDQLPVVVDLNRFLDSSSNTNFEINYQLPYNSLSFVQTDTGFEAGLDVEYVLSKDGQIVDLGDFSNKLIFPNQELTRSGKLFRDKLAVTLPTSTYTMQITFSDKNTSRNVSWSKDLIIFPKDTFLSDLEFSSNIIIDSTNFMEKFHRNNKLFFVNCNHIYTKDETDTLYIYYELGNAQYPVGTLQEKITIVKDEDTLSVETMEFACNGRKKSRSKKINISDLIDGYYNLIVEVIDPISDVVNKMEDYFTITSKKKSNYRLFVHLEDEIKLLKYFLPSAKTKIWNELTDDGKLKFIDKFWEVNNTSPSSKKTEYFELIKKRIKYCNEHYSHFNDGWNTDRGRIYIKHGNPDDIINGDTGFVTKYAQKKYEIWKYRVNSNFTYLFLDFQTNKNFKMIYSENDPQETSSPQIEAYLGEDFDMNLLD